MRRRTRATQFRAQFAEAVLKWRPGDTVSHTREGVVRILAYRADSDTYRCRRFKVLQTTEFAEYLSASDGTEDLDRVLVEAGEVVLLWHEPAIVRFTDGNPWISGRNALLKRVVGDGDDVPPPGTVCSAFFNVFLDIERGIRKQCTNQGCTDRGKRFDVSVPQEVAAFILGRLPQGEEVTPVPKFLKAASRELHRAPRKKRGRGGLRWTFETSDNTRWNETMPHWDETFGRSSRYVHGSADGDEWKVVYKMVLEYSSYFNKLYFRIWYLRASHNGSGRVNIRI